MFFSTVLLLSLVVNSGGPLPAGQVDKMAEKSRAVTDSGAPMAKTPPWHYMRALVYHLREQDGKATIELYKALDREPDYPEALFLMGLLYKERAKWSDAGQTLQRLIEKSPQHIPGQILLARVNAESENFIQALAGLEMTGLKLNMPVTYLERVRSVREIVDKSANNTVAEILTYQKLRQGIKVDLLDLVDQAERALLDTPDGYRAATIGAGVLDPLVFGELAGLYVEEDQAQNAQSVLQEALNTRHGFAPDVLLQLGEFYAGRKQNLEALKVLEQAINQLTQLGFSEQAGDFNSSELQQLRVDTKGSKNLATPAEGDTGKAAGKPAGRQK